MDKYDHIITTRLAGEVEQDHLNRMGAKGWELISFEGGAIRQYAWKKPTRDSFSSLSIAAQIRALEDEVKAVQERIAQLKASQPSEDTTQPKGKGKTAKTEAEPETKAEAES